MASRRDREAALDRVLELAVLVNTDMTKGLADLGLTEARAHLLWELHQRGPSTQRALADALQVSARNVTGLVDALVDTGFVSREPHPTDRRATLVVLTTRGAEVADGLERGRAEFAAALFDGMPGVRLRSLVAALDAVLDRMRSLVGQEEGERQHA